MSLNFGNSVLLSMEGISVRQFSKEKVQEFVTEKIIPYYEKKVFDHLSRVSYQCYMYNQILILCL